MLKQGRINLLDPVGEQYTSARYESVRDRNKIIQTWRKLYGGQFFRCQITIQMDEQKHYRTNPDGTNDRTYKEDSQLRYQRQ